MGDQTGAAQVARALKDAGVKRVFGVPGQRILPLFHELQNNHGIPVVLTRHEQGAAFMADISSRLGELGCCAATSGPGGINLLAGLASAYMDSVPLISITAQADTHEFGKYGIQEGSGIGRTPHVMAMVGATSKAAAQPMSLSELSEHLPSLLASAIEGRPGPVHIDVPSDLFTESGPVPDSFRTAPAGPRIEHGSTPTEQIIDSIRLLDMAERPLILVGNGVVRAGAIDSVMRFAESRDIAIAGTFLAKNILDERHPLVLGPVGVYGRRAANIALHEESDLIIALGVSFSYLSTVNWPTSLGRSMIRVDIDERELSNNYTAQVAVSGDITPFIEGMLAQPESSRFGGEAWVKSLIANHPDTDGPSSSQLADGQPLHPASVIAVLNGTISQDTIVVSDVGQTAYWVERYLRTRGRGNFLINGGLGAMGHGVAGAVAAGFIAKDRNPTARVVCICGDGGFMMGGLEVSTAVQNRLDVTWIIFNNSTLGTQSAWFERQGLPVVASEMPEVDYAQLAESMGAIGHTATTLEEVQIALQAAESPGCHVIEVVVRRTQPPAPFTPAADPKKGLDHRD